MDDDATLYIEAFVEANGDGYRYRISESDPGTIEIEYQEWNKESRTWERRGERFTLPAMHAKKFCDAIIRVAATTV